MESQALGVASRRRILAAAAASLALIPALSGAQPAGKTSRIAILALPNPPLSQTVSGIAAFRRELNGLGWVEGRNVTIESRHVDRDALDEAAARIVRERFDVIVAFTIPAAVAAKKATATIPIVMASNADPIGSGLIASLGRPGGNVTGTTFAGQELPGKRLELLNEMVPRLARVGAVYPEHAVTVPYVVNWLKDSETAAHKLGLVLRRVAVSVPTDWDSALAGARRDGVRGLIVVESPELVASAEATAAAALRQRLPAVFGGIAYVRAGGLMAYSAHGMKPWERAAGYVDKILRGAKPADLPVEQASSFNLVINAGTARTLGLTIPPTLRLQASEILE